MQKKYTLIITCILLICYYPLLFPGYIFSLDQAIPYAYSWLPAPGANIYWLHIIGYWFSSIWIPTWILEKLIYILMFSVIWFYGYKLLQKTKSDLVISFGLLFLFLNPFLYARFVEWQVNIYLSYILFVPFFYYLIEFFHYKKYSLWKYLAPLSLLLCLTSIHNIFIIALLLSIFSIAYLYHDGVKTLWKYVSILALSTIILNSLWIFPTMQRNDLTEQISSFQQEHRDAFQSPNWTYWVYTNIASLRGYWWESEKRFIPAELQNIHYIYLVILLYLLVWLGINKLWKDRENKSFVITLATIATLSYIWALWISGGNIFAWINSFLLDNLPYYNGFREPQKWVLIYTFILIIFSAHWVKTLEQYLINSKKRQVFLWGFSILIIIFPIIYTPATLIGHWWQLRPKLYPASWQEIQTQSYATQVWENCTTKTCYSTLILPWHGYLGIRWTETSITLSGVMKYFSPTALVGDTIEIRNIYTQSQRPESKIIESYWWPMWSLYQEYSDDTISALLHDLQNLGISQIVLVREADFEKYETSVQQLIEKQVLKKVQENDDVVLYEILFEK